MGLWHDIGALIPPDTTFMYFRRYPEDTPVVFGTWDTATAQASIGPGHWPLPWLAITHWRDQNVPVPDYPPPAASGRTWRDIFWQPPADQQFGWVRRYDNDCATIMAQFSTSTLHFSIAGTAMTIPWWAVWRWKPA